MIVHKEFVSTGTTINAAYYKTVLHCLQLKIRRIDEVWLKKLSTICDFYEKIFGDHDWRPNYFKMYLQKIKMLCPSAYCHYYMPILALYFLTNTFETNTLYIEEIKHKYNKGMKDWLLIL